MFNILLFSKLLFGLTTAYVTFEHPENWRCELAQGVWICQSNIETERRESVVLSIAAIKTEWDNFDNYQKYLEDAPNRPIQDEEGKTIIPSVTYVRKRNINGVTWVDSLQRNSELPGYWTRYVATVSDKFAILITYIVSDDFYKKLAPQFEKMVSSLKPNPELDVNVASQQGETPFLGTEIYGKRKDVIASLGLEKKKPIERDTPDDSEESQSYLFEIVVIAIAIAAILYILKRKKKRIS